MGNKLKRNDYIDDALNQYYWHQELLQDEKTNLFYHGWDNVNKNHMSGIFWARGNSWVTLTMAEALKMVPVQNPYYMEIEGSLRDHLSALVRLQDETGLWHTVLTDKTTYLETSASSGIATGLTIYGLPLHKKFVLKALDGILNNIDDEGTVKNVSAGTAVMNDIDGYKKVPKKRIQGWGQGLTLAFLCSILEKYKS
jgi:unsaturated rhamnogalacturonyl hydrolase